MSRLGEQPNASVPQASDSVAETQAIYRFWANPIVKASAILNSHGDGVRCRGRAHQTVLAIQDITELNYRGHPHTAGLGFINQTSQQGMNRAMDRHRGTILAKSGRGIEHLQLNSAFRLRKALATYSIVAWRLMGLAYRARLTPDESCQEVLQPAEWKLLRRKFAPKNRSKIAQLGEFLARKGDGNPGVKTSGENSPNSIV